MNVICVVVSVASVAVVTRAASLRGEVVKGKVAVALLVRQELVEWMCVGRRLIEDVVTSRVQKRLLATKLFCEEAVEWMCWKEVRGSGVCSGGWLIIRPPSFHPSCHSQASVPGALLQVEVVVLIAPQRQCAPQLSLQALLQALQSILRLCGWWW